MINIITKVTLNLTSLSNTSTVSNLSNHTNLSNLSHLSNLSNLCNLSNLWTPRISGFVDKCTDGFVEGCTDEQTDGQVDTSLLDSKSRLTLNLTNLSNASSVSNLCNHTYLSVTTYVAKYKLNAIIFSNSDQILWVCY